MERVDCVVIGAGVIGLSIARELAMAGREVIILEREGTIGTGISSRSSEVIHGGMYYPKNSLKAQLCIAGNKMLREFAATHGVSFRMVGKLIVATSAEEENTLAAILQRGNANGVEGLQAISATEALAMEPQLRCTSALWSPNTGIIDSHALMLAIQGEAETHGAIIAFHAPVESGEASNEGVVLAVGGAEPMRLVTRTVVVAAGLGASTVARAIGLPDVPLTYLCKGSYFSLAGSAPFRRLVYPVPVNAGLGIHYTLDLGGCGRFGPDVEWIEHENYDVDPTRSSRFYTAIRRYWPALADHSLEPAYSGIRPKIQAADRPSSDFMIAGPRDHGVAGVVAFYGIESPGLTASLALAKYVAERLI